MNYEAAILYAMRRMREIGRCPDQYDFEPIRIVRTYADLYTGKIIIYAYNELYILIHAHKYSNLLIVADNTVYKSDTPKSGKQEFTGKIQLLYGGSTTATGGTASGAGEENEPPPVFLTVEFLRVVY